MIASHVNLSKAKGFAVATIVCLTLSLHVVPVWAGNAARQSSGRPYVRLYHSLNVRPGVYYLVSPEIVTPAKLKPFYSPDIDMDVKQLKLSMGYVIVYGKNEKLAGRAPLAMENMQVIRSHLSAPSSAMQDGSTVQAMGLPEIESLRRGASYMCHLKFIGKLPSRLILPTAGKELRLTQYCVGFGIAAALAGYRVRAARQGLEFRRVLDVQQGSAVSNR